MRFLIQMTQNLLGLSLCLLSMGCNSSDKELHVYTWANYLDPETLKEFEKKHQCTVVLNYFDSNESMYAKLKLGASGYDIIFPSNYYVGMMYEQGLIQPLDMTLLPNQHYVDPAYAKELDPSLSTIAIPYMITWTGLGYYKNRVNLPEPSWGVFSLEALKGRMTMLNDPREAIGAALKYLGYSLNTTSPQEVEAATQTLIGWKKNLAKFESEQYKTGLASGEYLAVQGFSGEISQVSDENPDVVFALPKEGTIYSIDVITLGKDAHNIALAHAFIDFLLNPDVAARNIIYTQFLLANQGAYPKLPQRLKTSPAMFPPADIVRKSELIKYLGSASELYYRAWDDVKAAE